MTTETPMNPPLSGGEHSKCVATLSLTGNSLPQPQAGQGYAVQTGNYSRKSQRNDRQEFLSDPMNFVYRSRGRVRGDGRRTGQ